MMQSRRASFGEACAGTAIGYGVALLTQLIVFPLVGLDVSFDENIFIAFVFTAVSLLRGYYVRRLFNWWGNKHG